VLPGHSGTFFGVPAAAHQLTTVLSGFDVVWGLANNPAGDLFISGYLEGTIWVLPAVSGTVFGQAVVADQLSVVAHDSNGPMALALDTAGDLFVANAGGVNVQVLPVASGTLLGVAVTADQLSTVVPDSGFVEIAVDQSGNLFVGGDDIEVLAADAGTYFGVHARAGVLTTVVPDVDVWGAMTFDAAGNLFFSSANASQDVVDALPATTGRLFGVPVRADHVATIVSVIASGLSFNRSGGLFLSYMWGSLWELPHST
jgi:hypothetical protein